MNTVTETIRPRRACTAKNKALQDRRWLVARSLPWGGQKLSLLTANFNWLPNGYGFRLLGQLLTHTRQSYL